MRASLRAMLVALAAAGACRLTRGAAGDDTVRVAAGWVTGAAQAAVDPTSHLFRLPPPPVRDIGLARAETLARGVTRLLADPATVGGMASAVSGQHGAPIDFRSLHPCARSIYSITLIGKLPEPVPGWQRRALASQWAVPLCDVHNAAVISVSIPDAPSDLRLSGDGSLIFRSTSGGGTNFFVTGLPASHHDGLALSPELAVKVVFERTGARTRDVPSAYELFDGNAPVVAHCASWRVPLEHAVRVTTASSDVARSVDELFVHRAPWCFSDSIAFYTPSADQLRTFTVTFLKDTLGRPDLTRIDSAFVPVVGPLRLDRVEPVTGRP